MQKNTHERNSCTKTDEDSNSLCRGYGVVGLQPPSSEVEISLEEISEKVETIYVFSPPDCKEIIPYKPPHFWEPSHLDLHHALPVVKPLNLQPILCWI